MGFFRRILWTIIDACLSTCQLKSISMVASILPSIVLY